MDGVNKNCPMCDKADNTINCQSLSFTETGKLVDIYGYKCSKCGHQYSVESKPLVM